MKWISGWIQGIIVAVIIGTIIEMILPEGNSKKYIKVVIGVYILCSIVSPIITKITGSNLNVSNIFDLNEYIEASSNSTSNDLNQSQEEQIKSIYEANLKKDMKEKIESKGYKVNTISLVIENNNDYTLKNINITLKKEDNTNTNSVQNINEVNVQVNNTQKDNEKEVKNITKKISINEEKELKQYLSSVYEIEEKNISIN